jgi:hypothetical protein
MEDIEAALVKEWGTGAPVLVHPTEQQYPGNQLYNSQLRQGGYIIMESVHYA